MAKKITKSDAIRLFGSAANLAKAIGVSDSAVSSWGSGRLSDRNENAVRGAYRKLEIERAEIARKILGDE